MLKSCTAPLPAASATRSDTLCVPSPSAIGPPQTTQAPPSSAASRPTSPEPGAGSLAAALTVTPDTYQPLSPSVPDTCPEISGGRLSRFPEAEPMLEVSP